MRIVKKVIEIGNGAAVYVPKEYSGKEVIVVLPEGIHEIKKRILSSLIEFMPNIIGVYLYGSYARHEQTTNSDIDILIITKEKDENIKNTLEDIDLRVVPIQAIKKSIKNYPLLIMPILKESITLLNPLLLEVLRNSKIDIKKFKWNFDDVKRIIKIIEKFIEIDDKDISPSHIYSLIMRLRVCYLIECLLKNKKFTNNAIEKLLLNYGLKKEVIDRFFYVYRTIRENEEPKIKVEKDEILDLINFIKYYSERIENEAKKKAKKRH